jgi:peptide-methionine (S)-S-oxide reductase
MSVEQGEGFVEGLGQRFRTVAAERFVDGFQPADQIEHGTAVRRAAGGEAEVGAASERPGLVHEAPGVGSQQRTGAVAPLRRAGAARRAQPAGEDQRLATGQVRGFSGLAEMTAAGPKAAIAIHRPPGHIVVDSANLGQRFVHDRRIALPQLGLTTHASTLRFLRPSAQPCRMKIVHFAALALLAVPLAACGAEPASPTPSKQPVGPPVTDPPMTETQQTATLANGCFWCTEAVFQRIKGVEKVVSGYIGGQVKNPTYDEVSEGTTGHAEAVQITFDPKVVSFEKLLEVFWASHDPTTLNRQGHDVGTQYRSGIFYHSEEQKKTAEESKAKHQPDFKDPIVTEITKADVFYPAEGYHQNYYNLNSTRNPYCRVVIWPKLKKLGLDLKPTE